MKNSSMQQQPGLGSKYQNVFKKLIFTLYTTQCGLNDKKDPQKQNVVSSYFEETKIYSNLTSPMSKCGGS